MGPTFQLCILSLNAPLLKIYLKFFRAPLLHQTLQTKHQHLPILSSMASISSFTGTSPNLLSTPRCSNSGSGRWSYRKTLKALRASTFSSGLRLEMDENPEGIISGEWPVNSSLLCYEDLRAYLETQEIKSSPSVSKTQHMAGVREIMSTPVLTAFSDQTLEEVSHAFKVFSMLPVVDRYLRCIGVISKIDMNKATHGYKTRIGEIMSSPAVTLSENQTVMEAAALMLNKEVHRIPVVNREGRVTGIITRKDVLKELEASLRV